MSIPDLNNDVTGLSSMRNAGSRFAGFYALIRQLDGDVWLAQDEVRGEDVSLHFVPVAIRSDDHAMQALRLDVKKSRQLIHPNILRVYDFVEDTEGVAVAMEAFDGESLATHIDRQAGRGAKFSDIQPWAEQVARTLEAAHKINVLHRDLTPSNIFLTSAGKAFIAGFGISRHIRDAQTRAGESRPSAFTSPQILDGKEAARLDDVYSFGSILYTLAVGKAPFMGDDVAAQVRAGLTAEGRIALEGADLPVNWREAILACLDRDPAARPQSAAELGSRLAVLPAATAPVGEPGAIVAPAAAPVMPSPTPPAPEGASSREGTEPALQRDQRLAVAPQPAAERAVEKPAEPQLVRPIESRPATKAAGPKVSPAPAADRKPDAAKATRAIAPEKDAARPGSPNSIARKQPAIWRNPIAIAGAAAVVIVGVFAARHATPGVRPPPTEVRRQEVVAPTPAPVVSEVASAASSALAKEEAALDKAREDARTAEQAQSDLRKHLQDIEEGLATAEKSLGDKSAALKLAKKAAEESSARRKALEGDRNAAETAANEAQKVASEKARQLEESAAALKRFEEANAERMAAPQLTETEIAKLQAHMEEQRHAMADGAAVLAAGEEVLKRHLSEIADHEREVEKMKAMAVAGMTKKRAESVPPLTPAPSPMVVTTTPAAPTPAPSTPANAAETAAAGSANSLGMKFVPVGNVEFCIWPTRFKDFEVFAKAVNLTSHSWKTPGFKQEPDHPVVNVSWQEAIAFCEWLTDKEHKDKTLAANLSYRLPTDLEWSRGVGLPEETGSTPEKRDMAIPDVYPWGTGWPPPPGSGNYTGEENGSGSGIKGYDDGYSWTSPVGSFHPNKFGLFDMGGNVWQWCMDTWNGESKNRVLRGASWYNGPLRLSLLSSCRVHAAPNSSTDNYGFRIVRAKDGTKAVRK